MKRLLIALTLVAVFAAVSFAAVKDFGKFTVDVPDNWTASQDGPTAVIVKNDNTASLTITFAPTEGAGLGDIAKAFTDSFKGNGLFKSVSEPEKDEDGDYTFSMVNNQDVESKALLTGDDSNYCLFVMTGIEAAADEISAMLDSVKDK